MKDCAIAWPEKQRAFETFIECKLVVKVMELHVPVIDGASKFHEFVYILEQKFEIAFAKKI